MTFFIYTLFILFIIGLAYLFSSDWEILITGTEQQEGEKIYGSYYYLKQKNIRCKLKKIEHDIFINDVALNLLVKRSDLEEAKQLLKERST